MNRSIWNQVVAYGLVMLVLGAGCMQPHPDPPEGEALQAFITTAWKTAPPRAFRQVSAPYCQFPAKCLCPPNSTMAGATRWQADTLAVVVADIELASAPRFDVLPASGLEERIVYWPVFVSIEVPCRLLKTAWGGRSGPGSLAAQVVESDAKDLAGREANRDAQSEGAAWWDTEASNAAQGDSVVVAEGAFTGYLYLDREGAWTLSWMPALPMP